MSIHSNRIAFQLITISDFIQETAELSSFLNEIRNRYELEGDAIRVDGHTDDVPLSKKGKYKNNWELSTVRATNVAALMMEKVGFNPERIAISGYADTRPKASYVSENGNRKSGRELQKAFCNSLPLFRLPFSLT